MKTALVNRDFYPIMFGFDLSDHLNLKRSRHSILKLHSFEERCALPPPKKTLDFDQVFLLEAV